MFENLAGNSAVRSHLARLIANGRFPNSVLFAGPGGVGKKTFALEVAKALVCTSDGHEACGRCAACNRAGRLELPKAEKRDDFKRVIFTDHPDVGIVAAHNRTIFVDAIRDLEREAHFRPYEAKARVFIIDDAEKLNDAASNALLKTLEEPASTSFLILITSRPGGLLPTIRSRCQMIRFAPVEPPEIEKVLLGAGRSAQDAAFAAHFAAGSVADALAIDVENVREIRDALVGLIRDATAGRIAGMLQASEWLNDAQRKDLFEDNLLILERLVHDVWLLKKGSGKDVLLNADIADDLERVAADAPTGLLTRWIDEIDALRAGFIVNINRRIASDAMLLKASGI